MEAAQVEPACAARSAPGVVLRRAVGKVVESQAANAPAFQVTARVIADLRATGDSGFSLNLRFEARHLAGSTFLVSAPVARPLQQVFRYDRHAGPLLRDALAALSGEGEADRLARLAGEFCAQLVDRVAP
jgi:hypothetical protein